MTKSLTALSLGLALAASSVAVVPAQANVIKRACLKADRAAATRALCGCIQDVADATLTRSDQRRGAKYFKEPEVLQDVRQSDNPSHERFWKEWKAFGLAAKDHCS